jgi:hypothetical protein
MFEACSVLTSTEIQLILVAILVVVLLFEIWYRMLRRKRIVRGYVERGSSKGDDFDEAYNSIASTEKIAAVLRAQGVDTADAERALAEAKRAHARGDRERAVSRATSARSSLMDAKRQSTNKPAPMKPAVDLTVDVGAEPQAHDGAESLVGIEEPPSQTAIQKLPDNYLQSKFMITTAEASIAGGASDGRDVSGAEKALAGARDAFGREEYGRALSLALKAKKLAEGTPAGQPVDQSAPAVLEVGASAQADPGEPGARGGGAEHGMADADLACPDCKTSVKMDDAFCRKCGGRLEFRLECHGCGTELDKGDAFCRKCGAKMG